MHDEPELDYDVNDRPCLILELPVLSDEAALRLSEFLQRLAEHFDAHHTQQILRAHRAREEESERLYREQCLLTAQRSLPFADDPF